MFAKNLLLFDCLKDNIKPKYLYNSELVEKILSAFKKSVGKKYKDLHQKLKMLEAGRTDYKIIRSLVELLQRRCEFVSNTELNIIKVRRSLFEKGFVIDKSERESIIAGIANDFGVSKTEIESAMFADLHKEQILKNINNLTAEELIKNYNLSITQTLLFNALEMTFTVGGNYQQIFRMINYLGLMYETDGNKIRVTGATSLLKNTKKYGVSLAKLIPNIITSEKWSIEAKIGMERNNNLRIFTLKLNSYDKVLFPSYENHMIEFDSNVEEQFFKDFKLFAPDWKIEREPTFIKAGNYVIIPDFGFYKNDLKLYMEIVGFWTPEYIRKKISKFNQTKTKIIVALNQFLKCSNDDFPGDVIMYKKRIPLKPILNILKREETKKIKKEIDNSQTIKIEEKIVELNSKAKELGISPQALEKINIPNYSIIGKKLVSEEFLIKLKEEIGNKRKFSEVKDILDKYELTDKALDLIGYKIVWNGLTPLKIINTR